MSYPLRTTGWQRRPQGVATAGETAPVETALASEPTGLIRTEGWRGMRIWVIGDTHSDDIDIEVWTVERTHAVHADAKPKHFFLPRLFLGIDTITVGDPAASTGGGVAGNEHVLLENEQFADTYPAPTISTYGTRVLQMFNGVVNVYSPGNTSEQVGEIFISDLGNPYGVVLVFDTMAQNYADAMFKLEI